jgi:carbonyl reductase 1
MMTTPITTSVGRVAVITGANKGVGFFIALQLATCGLFQHVLLACRDSARGQEAVAKIIGLATTLTNHRQVTNTNISYLPLTLGNVESHRALRESLEKEYGKIDCLVNNAAIAFKASDATPFRDQCKPTLDINFRGTVDLTEQLLPLIKKGSDPRIVNVASMSGRLRQITSRELRDKFKATSLTIPELHDLVDKFEQDVISGQHTQQGWGNSNYGMSKLALMAATKVWARENPDVAINSCCPGYCKTDMSSQMGGRDPSEGARNAVIPATMQNPPTGRFFEDFAVSLNE